MARQPGSVVTVSGNTVVGQGVTSGAAENSIEIAFGATGSVTGNTAGADDFANPSSASGSGILIFQSAHVSVSKNNVSNTQTGIGVFSVNPGDADSASITSNTISGTHSFDGIDACSSNNTITGNTVNGSDQSGHSPRQHVYRVFDGQHGEQQYNQWRLRGPSGWNELLGHLQRQQILQCRHCRSPRTRYLLAASGTSRQSQSC